MPLFRQSAIGFLRSPDETVCKAKIEKRGKNFASLKTCNSKLDLFVLLLQRNPLGFTIVDWIDVTQQAQ